MPGPTRRRVYTGSTEAEASDKFEADATEAARFDWFPTAARSWRGTSLTVLYERREPPASTDDPASDTPTMAERLEAADTIASTPVSHDSGGKQPPSKEPLFKEPPPPAAHFASGYSR